MHAVASTTEPTGAQTTALNASEMTLLHVKKSYGEKEFQTDVVRNCSFAIERGKLTVMIGPSGCGKSTLIRLLAGFERPSGGSVSIDGKKVTGPGHDRLVLFQETALFPWMTTGENVMYGPKARGQNTKEMRERGDYLLDKVGLTRFRNKYPSQLSGGMQRRAELARAMINDPSIMILDEPFRGLDHMTKELMWEYYSRLFEETGRTNFFVTTDIDEAIYLADRLIIMTNRPTRVRTVVEVDWERPRKLADLVDNDAVNLIKQEVLQVLHQEAMKSFAGGSKAAADFVNAFSKRVGG